MEVSPKPSILIVGGGWAGIAAAIALVHQGKKITLVEASRQLGGRARGVYCNNQLVDNGQHILLGAYRHYLRLLRILGAKESDFFLRWPLQIYQYKSGKPALTLRTNGFPAPLHLAFGLMMASGISRADRFRALLHWQELVSTPIDIADDINVQQWLLQHRQPASITSQLWAPLCLAALNTTAQEASARIFQRVLQESFAEERRASDILIPKRDLTSIFAGPALEYLEGHGSSILLSRTVTGLCLQDDKICGVETKSGTIRGDQLILATNVETTLRLISPVERLQPVAQQLKQLNANPICTIYLQLHSKFSLPKPMIASLNAPAQWFFDRSVCGQAGLIAAVISGPGPHMELAPEALCQAVEAQFARLLPSAPAVQSSFCIREKRATLACSVAVDGLRPGCVTEVENLFLAGEFTATGLPGTLEGAVRSGNECANRFLP